jgi:hypothetical protein
MACFIVDIDPVLGFFRAVALRCVPSISGEYSVFHLQGHNKVDE